MIGDLVMMEKGNKTTVSCDVTRQLRCSFCWLLVLVTMSTPQQERTLALL
jgi:hypothetical protein